MELHNLGNRARHGFTTWGCMWETGECTKEDNFILWNGNKEEIPMQSRITAYWPDGSVKWSAHTAESGSLGENIEVVIGNPITLSKKIEIQENDEHIKIKAGTLEVDISKENHKLFDKVIFQGDLFLLDAEPVLQLEEPGIWQGNPIKVEKKYNPKISEIFIEDRGDLQVTIKFTGHYERENGESIIPFIIRMKIGVDSKRLDFVHTFLYDGDENKDFLKGLGISCKSPVRGELYNRHVKFSGDYGVFHESLAQLVSWKPRVPDEIYARQIAGEFLDLEGTDKETVDTVLKDMPFWSEYDFCQVGVNQFNIKKKLKDENCCFIDCLHGNRSEGGASFGSECGSVLFSIKDFWEKYPSGYTFCNLDGDFAEAVIWLWSPQAEPMDFRHYANRGYNQVYYEGYDYKGATPYGIACTNEFSIQFSKKMVPLDEELIDFTNAVKKPPVYVATPEFYHQKKAFGYWSMSSRNTEMENWLEDQLNIAVEFYKKEVSQRNWYGMFNYGDFMHTYDKERHQWRYDMGGFAWDNTELVPTLWLWYAFMRTGREDIFILAEKLSRHASEVDVYHMGKYKGLGSRHNVRHWGCPCKEARIAMAAHHRFYYYMTGDRRFEDIFEELKDNELTFLNKDPLADFFEKDKMIYPSHARSGPDWSSLCANWMTRWERFNDEKYRDKIRVGMEDIKKAPLQLISGPDFEFDPETVHLLYFGERTKGATHLQICMGAPQVWMEMADLLGDEEWKKMLAEYGRFYFLPREEQMKESGDLIGNREFTFPFMATAMGAYGAYYLKDKVLAERTWKHLLHTMISDGNHEGFQMITISNKGNQKELSEIPWISTNFVAQWCLNTIVVLDFIRNELPKTLTETDELVKSMDEVSFRKA